MPFTQAKYGTVGDAADQSIGPHCVSPIHTFSV